MMDSLHWRAEIAVAAMMVDYMSKSRGPDCNYQLLGYVLTQSDEEMIQSLFDVSSVIADALKNAEKEFEGIKAGQVFFSLMEAPDCRIWCLGA